MKIYHLIPLIILLSITSTYGQEKEKEDENENERVNFEAKSMKSIVDESRIAMFDQVKLKIDNKLDIEADSAVFDVNDKLLITYGTRRFEFKGTVIARDGNKGICKYSLGEDVLIIE